LTGHCRGIGEEQFYLNRAAVCWEGNLDGQGQFASVTRPVTADEIQRGAVYAARGHADVAVEMLSQGVEKVDGHSASR